MTIVADDFSPIYQHDTGAEFRPQFLHKDGSAMDLTGATITMIMQDSEGNVKAAAGFWTVDNTLTGQTHFDFDAADVDTAGNWTLFIAIAINSKTVHADTKQLQILPVPTP